MADFSATQICNIRGIADQMFIDNKTKMTPPEVGVLQAINENNTAKIQNMFDSRKGDGMCTTVELAWLKDAGLEVVDNTACEFGEDEGDSDLTQYDLDINKSTSFQVDEEHFNCANTFEMEDATARLYNEAMKVLEEYFASAAVAKIDAAKGVNLTPDAIVNIGVVVGNETYIGSDDFNASSLGYLSRVSIMNKFSRPWLLSGSNLYDAVWDAEKSYGNWDGKGNFAKFASLPIWFDLFNIDEVNSPDFKTYMIDAGTMTYVSKSYYQDKGIVKYMTEIRWSEQSRVVPGLWFDVHYTNECGDGDFMKHKFKFKMKGGIFQAPYASADRTGVLSFINGAAPESES